jgi:hypothetical protein
MSILRIQPSTEITWGKRDAEAENPPDVITIGKPGTVVTWGKE